MSYLKKIKHELRSVIISCRTAVTLNELCTAFKNFTGGPIPFSNFGYPDLESFLMDIPDVIDTVWYNGEMRLICKRDRNDITLESLMVVINHSKKSKTLKNITGHASCNNRCNILIPRSWQDKITAIIKQNENNCMSIKDLVSKISYLDIGIPTERTDIVGILRRCWNMNVNVDRTMVYIKYKEDHLKYFIDQFLKDNESGLNVEEFLQTYRYHQDKDLELTRYGFDCVLSIFKYYSNHYSIFHEGNGMIKVYAKNVRTKLNSLKFNKGDYFICKIKCINDPHSFWIIPYNNERKELLKQHINNIINPKDIHHCNLVKFNDVKVNHIIVAKWHLKKSHWSRCIVVDKSTDNLRLCVFFVDYGVYSELPSDAKMFSLPNDSILLEIPRMAVHATLYKIKPIDKNWSSKCIKYFYHCISNKKLHVTVLDDSGNQLSVNISRNTSLRDEYENNSMSNEYADVTSNMALHGLLRIFDS